MPKAKDKDVLQELVPFLGDRKADVRAIALQNLLAYTDNEPGRLMLQGTDIITYLVKLLREELKDDDPRRRQQTKLGLYTSLVNLSGDEIFSQTMLKLNVIEKVMETIGNEDATVSQLQSMLLVNLTISPQGSMLILGTDSQRPGVYLQRLVEVFSRPSSEQDPFAHLANVFVNLTRLQEGRALFLNPSQPIVPYFIPHFGSQNPTRRQVLAVSRNVLFETDFDHLFKTDFLEKLLWIVVGAKPFSAKDTEGMPGSWVSVNRPDRVREPDREIRKIIVDILVLMAASLQGRLSMRSLKVYPVLRDWHLDESDEEIMEMITLVVQYILLNDDVEEEMKATDAENKMSELD